MKDFCLCYFEHTLLEIKKQELSSFPSYSWSFQLSNIYILVISIYLIHYNSTVLMKVLLSMMTFASNKRKERYSSCKRLEFGIQIIGLPKNHRTYNKIPWCLLQKDSRKNLTFASIGTDTAVTETSDILYPNRRAIW